MEPTKSTGVVELRDWEQTSPHIAPSESSDDPVNKIGHKATVPKTLNNLLGLIGLNSSICSPWPNFYFVPALNLANGGTLGLLIGTIIACVCMMPVYLSLAGMMRA
jgi:hypothetical protein